MLKFKVIQTNAAYLFHRFLLRIEFLKLNFICTLVLVFWNFICKHRISKIISQLGSKY